MPNKDIVYCDRIETKFDIAYSKAGVSYFGCPFYSNNNQEDIVCMEARTLECPVLSRFEEMIKRRNGKE